MMELQKILNNYPIPKMNSSITILKVLIIIYKLENWTQLGVPYGMSIRVGLKSSFIWIFYYINKNSMKLLLLLLYIIILILGINKYMIYIT